MKYLINCEINFILTWIVNFIISQRDVVTTFAMADTKLYVLILNLSIQDNTKLLQEMKLGLKRTINWNKYKSIERQNQYLDDLIDPSLQNVNRLFVIWR